ncbi:MAG: ATP-binding cassette domain-containing protein [candidate division Zixibacteria bacterium]|nr:ATP-binding cassette domain-containing protein [candidate division Zixibacteria bacterium]
MTMPSQASILEIEGISKRFQSVFAVRDLSLAVPRGSIYGIIGPNGAGKTTTIRMILDILAPDTGTISFHFRNTTVAQNDSIGFLPEERGLYKRMTVEDVLVYMAQLKSVPPNRSRPKIDAWLSRMELSEWKKRKVQELSKGMQQKVQFISTILHEPELVILDEPFAGLDPVNQELLKDIVLELKAGGATVLFSSHVMEQAEKICDHLCMIDHGQKVLDGPLSQVKSGFGADILVVEGDLPGAALAVLPGVIAVRSERLRHELTLAASTDHQQLMSRILTLGRVDGIQRLQPSLHSIFLTMAGKNSKTGA